MIQIYCGDGKGKTTAAMGLAVRAAGRGNPVVIAQFLKSADSGERLILGKLSGVTLLEIPDEMKFVFAMNEEEKRAEREYAVRFTVGDALEEKNEPAESCVPDARTDTVVVIASDRMGEGAEELGKTLLKAFVFSLTQQDKLPKTILLYNGGAYLTCEGSPMLEDLKALEAEGVEILTCGTCLNFYGLTEKLAVGGVTNMYVIAEKMLGAGNVVKP